MGEEHVVGPAAVADVLMDVYDRVTLDALRGEAEEGDT
jgi:hypothetical protein